MTERGNAERRQDFPFLVLQHAFANDARVYDEYRVDVATGKKIQTEFVERTATTPTPASLSDLASSGTLPESAGPASQGFFSAWLYFYPTNRKQFDFRYLGEQQMNQRQMVVVAFAQKPALVQLPTMIDFEKQA